MSTDDSTQDDSTVHDSTVQDSTGQDSTVHDTAPYATAPYATAPSDTARYATVPHDAPTAAAGTAPSPQRAGVRVGTVVWGLIIALVGAGVLLVAAGYTIDVQLAAIVLLIAAGLGLILGPLLQGLRRSRTGGA
ncbi:hypothetical protein H9657_08965 [Cellulomonas sp. Sa3CUA2]|uniref:Uncharacterized protein n=1 Tax=Cellulomonas avistercoris TaxID=2762242 RepID=A0ABR8QDE8_9CELL|nr:hypothetical protein [Cellulomonas avistercoris]MBD7918406.1 hypothetical protein [Cellulomonas avistercoris]